MRKCTPRARARIAVVVIVACAPSALGCMNRDTTYVRVRSANGVAAEVDTPAGRRAVSPARGAPAEEEIPRTAPPYLGALRLGASVIRDPRGGLVIRCDACLDSEARAIVNDDGSAVVSGSADARVVWVGDELRWHVQVDRTRPVGRWTATESVLYVDGVTPKSNVLEVREDRRTDTYWGMWLGLGAVWTVAGAAILALTSNANASTASTGSAMGVTFLSFGAVFDLVALAAGLGAISSSRTLYAAPDAPPLTSDRPPASP